jgi:hypothetical protein
MTELLAYLFVSAAGLLAFIGKDAFNAFDGNPETHTLSEILKSWRRQGHTGGRTLLMAGTIFQGAFALVYLFGHLVLESW